MLKVYKIVDYEKSHFAIERKINKKWILKLLKNCNNYCNYKKKQTQHKYYLSNKELKLI